MKEKKKLTVTESEASEYQTFYIPISKLELTLFKIRAKTAVHAKQKFSFLNHDKASSTIAHRKITIHKIDSNFAYKDGEVPHLIEIINRQVDHYRCTDENLEPRSDYISLVH